ncbi:stage II sporulation protein M [Capnocytophaga cynodegmi]|uniref:Stage II sporulation protein M n=1 Tax=Capnocytophaga cynodegmi TaxID=28189 RepID=A0A0B7HBQ1_9FLAO|nr:stage II sporulation protein M [Capnocytophaga cynodegmi]CEN36695.1 membrane hypothetical protein [Capnocytophaga cynodegmi]
MLGKQKKNMVLQVKMIVLSLFFFFLGFSHSTFVLNKKTQITKERQILPITNDEYNYLFDADKDYSSMEIFLNNMRVGFFMSVIGFLSGGTLTVIILYWNGLWLANIFFVALNILPVFEIVYCLKHAPTEIFAFSLFSSIGFKGFLFYKKIFYGDDKDNVIPKPIEFVLPTLLLFFSSIIEVL